MEISIRPYHKNRYPLRGILIKNPSPSYWLKELSRMGISLDEIKVYAIPTQVPNKLWGCLLSLPKDQTIMDNIHIQCQYIENCLFIPQKTRIYPSVTADELKKMLGNQQALLHPGFGLVPLEETVDWNLMIHLDKSPIKLKKPAKGVYIPHKVDRIKVKEVSPEEVLKQLEEKAFPPQEKIESKPLSILEKIKLKLLKGLFKKDKGDHKISSSSENSGKGSNKDNFLRKLFFKKKWLDQLKMDLKELEDRNQKELDKLMRMFQNDPEEALKYAIPLNDGLTRGNNSTLDHTPALNLFGNNHGSKSNGGSVGIEDIQFEKLRQQYKHTAQQMEKNGDYKKAAFIHLKLLKDYLAAANVLKNGKHYSEAASVHLKYTGSKENAAACYEQGNMTEQAIDLYEQLNRFEKVGDLYSYMNLNKKADHFYKKVVDDHKENNHYIQASKILKEKMNEKNLGQRLLKAGWEQGIEPLSCLNKYFQDFESDELLSIEISNLYEQSTSDKNIELFLKALITENSRNRKTVHKTRDIAFQIISENSQKHPSFINQLKKINEKDSNIYKDILRFKNKTD